MTDKELLKLAAKAAGYLLEDDDDDGVSWTIWNENNVPIRWNPLTDDGDAMRLAVKLNISLHQEYDNESVDYAIAVFWLPEYKEIYESHGSDMYAINRRLVVIAAAEIGKTL